MFVTKRSDSSGQSPSLTFSGMSGMRNKNTGRYTKEVSIPVMTSDRKCLIVVSRATIYDAISTIALSIMTIIIVKLKT